jgi:hypothetical protein
MKTHQKTFPNRNNESSVAIGVAVAVASNSDAFPGLNFAHRGLAPAHPNRLAQRNRFEIRSAEDIWQRTRRR